MLMIRYYISDENEDNDEDDYRASDKIGLIRVVMEVLSMMVIRWFFMETARMISMIWCYDIPLYLFYNNDHQNLVRKLHNFECIVYIQR